MIVAHNRIRWFRAPAPNSCRFNEESTTIYWELSTIRPQFSLHSSHSLSLSLIQTIRNFRLRRTFEHGLMYHERKRWHAKQPQCVRQIQPKDLQVSTCNVWCKLWHTHKKIVVKCMPSFIWMEMWVSFLQVSIDTTGSAFFVLLLGWAISVFLLLVENVIWFYKRHQQMHQITYLKWSNENHWHTLDLPFAQWKSTYRTLFLCLPLN